MRFSDTERLIERKAAPLGDVARVIRRVHVDGPLLGGLLLIAGFGLVVLYSAVGGNMDLWLSQCVRLGLALCAMVFAAQLSPALLRRNGL